MPNLKWVVKDTVENLWLTTHIEAANHPQWSSNSDNAYDYGTEGAASTVAESLGGAPGRYIGTNPPPH